ncbi:MAG: hypothetical protein K9W46_00035 [Candidatus Heimdallarchaeum endolithica]|uniref:Uncharacterized protein n=1 Tax=Candidatus Heimdallarchaeum endolithica TaxID=2876572 RepID=A0A9Y1FNM4_9ARCH|nr:MAG: hypothetical protein K9W46_00035 [Candidatus Heimdallarchaeum endolithica]
MKRNIILYSLVMMLIISNVINISLKQDDGNTQKETDNINSLYPEKDDEIADTQEESYLQQSDSSALRQSYATTDNSYKVNMATQVDTSTWYQGETIKTEMKFNKQIPDYYTYTSELYHSGSTTPFEDVDIAIISPGASLKDDSSNTYITFSPDSDITIANYIRTTFYSKIYAGGSGALYAQGYARWYYSGSSYYSTSVTSDSYTISTSYLDGSGYLHIYVNIYADDSADKLTFMVGFMNYETGNYETVLQIEKTGCGSSNFHLATAVIDYLYFQREEIIDNVRSTYKYTTQTTKIHKLEIYSIANVESISIYYPKHMIFSSISPTASYSLSSNILTIDNPVELKYSLFFSSNSSNFLALKDVSSEFQNNIGFEKGLFYDWKNAENSPYVFETIEHSSSIVSEGIFSLKLASTDTGSDLIYFYCNNFEPGEYYISFDYYISNLEYGYYNPSELRFSYYSSSSWRKTVLGTSDYYIANRWQKAFIYADIIPDSSNRIFRIYSYGAKGEFYFDNIKIWKVSTDIKTICSNKYEISSTFISWDGYKNPSLSNHKVNFDIYDATTQTLEESYSLATNENGLATWTLNQELEEKEYEIRAYTYSNWFGDRIEAQLGDRWDFEDSDTWVGKSADLFEQKEYYVHAYDDGDAAWHGMRTLADFQIYDSDVFIYRIKGSTSDISFNAFWVYDGSVSYSRTITFSTPGSWEIYTWNWGYDFSVSEIRFESKSSGVAFDIYMDYLKIVDESFFSPFYFTPEIFTSDPVLYESSDYFVLSSTNDDYNYEIFSDNQFIGYYSDLEIIPKNLTAGNHNLTAVLYSDSQNQAYIPSTYEYLYTITESELCTLTFYDQQGRYIDARTFVIFVNSERIYGDSFIWSDVSQTINLEIQDIFGHVIYSNSTEEYERFKDFVLDYYSVKIQNQQELPVWVSISSNGQIFSSWIFSWEVEEFRIYSGSYTFTVYYCSDPTASFTQVTTNGTYVSYAFDVNSDTALIVTGYTIADIFGNTMSLMNDLELTNSSIHTHLESQTNNITIQIDNTNTNIDTQTNNIVIEITNTNSTLSQQLNTITTDIANLQTNITLQINDISSEINNLQTNITIQINDLNQTVLNVQTNQTLQYNELTSLINNFESSMDSQLNSISVSITNLQTNMTLQFNDIDTAITNTESNIISQINNLETIINNFETSMDSQLNYLYLNITNLQSNVTLQFNSISSEINNLQTNITIQINDLNQTVLNVQTNQTLQYNELTSLINNFESSMDSQLNSISVSITNLQTNMTLQFNDIDTAITNTESNIISQINNLETIINNFETSMDSQLNYLYLNITNLQSNVTLQFNSISSEINNLQTNMTIQINDLNQTVINVQTNQTLQYNELTSLINNFETNMDSQLNSINISITNLQTNMTLQFNDISNQITNINSTITEQLNEIEVLINNFETSMDQQLNSLNVSILNNRANITMQINELDIEIQNVHTEVIAQANNINANLENVNATIYTQTIEILNSIYNNNATIYNQTVTLLNAISQTNSTLYEQSISILNQIDLTNATQVTLLLQTYEYLLDQENYYTIYFILTNLQGVGLNFETAAIYVNNSLISDFKQIYYKNSLLFIEVRDWFNNTLLLTNITVSINNQIITLNLPLVEQTFENDYDVPVEVTLISVYNENETVGYTIYAHSSITILLFANSYHVKVTPLEDSYTNATHITYYYPETKKFQDLGYDSNKVYKITMSTKTEELYSSDEIDATAQARNAKMMLIMSAILNALLITFIGFISRYGIVKTWNIIATPIYYFLKFFTDLFELPAPKLFIKDEGGIDFVTVEQQRKFHERRARGLI